MTREDDLESILCESETRRRIVLLGVSRTLREWPSKLFQGLVVGAVLSLIVFGLTVLCILGPQTCHAARVSGGNCDLGAPTNLHFIKHENRSWSRDDYCHIETVARSYPRHNIFVTNLLENYDERPGLSSTIDYQLFFDHLTTMVPSRNIEDEMQSKLKKIPNVRIVNVSIEDFFKRSSLRKRVWQLTRDQLELAAKYQIIWNSPGISLEPSAAWQLDNLDHLINKIDCEPDASIQLDSDLQASSASCQSFVGLVMNQIARDGGFFDRRSLLKRSLEYYCPESNGCSGVRILQAASAPNENYTNCPSICSLFDVEADL
ncbi:uncharacterized protein LOC106657142 [Trichogramma pretiosum]|uniref:uncharacterized protein LOC106657142 n=1 Tax=Trichogramma pretiosum TaxID=7493 RepID=UPI0006C96F1C|nr:uncharacterized protein LOC106657142 [Trichogramma pretiosum]